MKKLILKLMPASLLAVYRREKRKLFERKNAQQTTEEVFSEIYSKNKWGGEKGEFCSGSGTANAAIAGHYVKAIRVLAEKHGFASLRAIDLGCGDMKIGSQICGLFQSYHGIDIVAPLIEHNKTRSFDGEVTFSKLDIIEEELPRGEVCFIRQVLQHLSNEQVGKILEKLKHYRFVIITEHVPSPNPELVKNVDKPHGGGIRLYKNSGVFLDCPPFSVSGSLEQVLELDDSSLQNLQDTGMIVTQLWRPNS